MGEVDREDAVAAVGEVLHESGAGAGDGAAAVATGFAGVGPGAVGVVVGAVDEEDGGRATASVPAGGGVEEKTAGVGLLDAAEEGASLAVLVATAVRGVLLGMKTAGGVEVAVDAVPAVGNGGVGGFEGEIGGWGGVGRCGGCSEAQQCEKQAEQGARYSAHRGSPVRGGLGGPGPPR